MHTNPPNGQIQRGDIPVLLTIFNRPDKTKVVMENLRQIKPKQFFVAADGPRIGHPHDNEKCRLARQVATSVDWTCDIRTRFFEDNLGCDIAVPSAIDWFFQNVEFGIILEDDCVVHPDYFVFCGELLIRYFDDKRIMQISSLSPYATREHPYDYHFGRTFRCSGGWSTWRRAWEHFTSDLHIYSDNEVRAILGACHVDHYECMRKYKKLTAYNQGIKMIKKNNSLILQYYGHWDYQWNLACSAQNGLCIVPERNLMINIGFDEDSTNTKHIDTVFENQQVHTLRFPLRHPPFVYADNRPEMVLEKRVYSNLPLKSRCMYFIRRVLGVIYYLQNILP